MMDQIGRCWSKEILQTTQHRMLDLEARQQIKGHLRTLALMDHLQVNQTQVAILQPPQRLKVVKFKTELTRYQLFSLLLQIRYPRDHQLNSQLQLLSYHNP